MCMFILYCGKPTTFFHALVRHVLGRLYSKRLERASVSFLAVSAAALKLVHFGPAQHVLCFPPPSFF